MGSTRDVYVLGVQRRGKRKDPSRIPRPPPLQPCSVLTTRPLLTCSHSASLMAPGKGILSPFLQQEAGTCPGPTIAKGSCLGVRVAVGGHPRAARVRNCGEHRRLNPGKTKKTCSHFIIYLKFLHPAIFQEKRDSGPSSTAPWCPDEAMAASGSLDTLGARLSGTLETTHHERA